MLYRCKNRWKGGKKFSRLYGREDGAVVITEAGCSPVLSREISLRNRPPPLIILSGAQVTPRYLASVVHLDNTGYPRYDATSVVGEACADNLTMILSSAASARRQRAGLRKRGYSVRSKIRHSRISAQKIRAQQGKRKIRASRGSVKKKAQQGKRKKKKKLRAQQGNLVK